jgi:hypothetical protein
MNSIINNLFTIILSLILANYGVEKLYHFVKKEALTKVAKGLPSMSQMTNKLTCKKFNAKMELVPYTEGSCAKKKK